MHSPNLRSKELCSSSVEVKYLYKLLITFWKYAQVETTNQNIIFNGQGTKI